MNILLYYVRSSTVLLVVVVLGGQRIIRQLDHEYSPHQPEPRRLCISLCGSERAMLQTKDHMARAKAELRGRTDVSFELAADYHG